MNNETPNIPANNDMEKYFFRASAKDFKKVPENPIAYWLAKEITDLFKYKKKLGDISKLFKGLSTGENERFIRLWHEINHQSIKFNCNSNEESLQAQKKWYPCNKGGAFRKWYGNIDSVINWQHDGKELRALAPKSVIRSPQHYFKPCLSWSKVTSGAFSVRALPIGFVPLDSSSSITTSDNLGLIGIINSKPFSKILSDISATLNFEIGHLSRMPIIERKTDTNLIRNIIDNHKLDWNSYETSWDFTSPPLLSNDYRQAKLTDTYQNLRTHWLENTLEMQRLEEENNRIFIDAYGLQDELTPDVPLKEITLTCNPHYRYGGENTEEELEAKLLADTMREFVSYAVGCMFGRYSLDKEGLVLANQGETLEDYLKQVPQPSFEPDADNVIPILDADWFTDDITERFRAFLRLTFGEEHYEENLRFIEKSLNLKNKRNYSIREYFLKEFYDDHVQTYKKRPIYWLFSSPKGYFNALIYMHRYQPYTVGTVLEYLRDYRTKLSAHLDNLEAQSINSGASQADKTRALKEIEACKKIIHELDDYERDTLYPLATQQISIDLDDGVKENYPKFGKALKKITGLS